MNMTRTFASLAAAVALVLTSAAPLATAASAKSWKRWHANRDHAGWSQRHAHAGSRTVYVYEKSKRNTVGTVVAIGLGALVLGLALSDAAHRHHGHPDY